MDVRLARFLNLGRYFSHFVSAIGYKILIHDCQIPKKS